jgi:hypothetical protein
VAGDEIGCGGEAGGLQRIDGQAGPALQQQLCLALGLAGLGRFVLGQSEVASLALAAATSSRPWCSVSVASAMACVA